MSKRILITTGIYPPQIGGPAQYAKNLREEFERIGNKVSIKTYGLENNLPTGVRHLVFFLKIIPSIFSADMIFVLDTFSVGLPTVALAKIFGKKSVIRTGGDFLWEQYVERTKKKVLLKDFYSTQKRNFSLKEKVIFSATKWTLKNCSHVVFSTEWQRNIFIEAYGLNKQKTSVIENYYGPKEGGAEAEGKVFVSSSRGIFLKQESFTRDIFNEISGVELFDQKLPFPEFMRKVERSYAVICLSLSEISPNLILDAIRFNRPFICTKEVGIYDRIKDAGIFVDPLSKEDIKLAIEEIMTEEGYKKAKEKVRNFNFVHTWDDIAQEFLNI